MRWVTAGALALSIVVAGVARLAGLVARSIEEGAARIP